MAFIHRLSRLLLADAHAVLDQLESPVTVLRQMIREMEDAITNLRTSNSTIQQHIQYEQRVCERLNVEIAQLQQQLMLSLNAAREDWAKQLVRQRLSKEQAVAISKSNCRDLHQQLMQQQQQLQQWVEKLEAVQQRAALMVSSDEAQLVVWRPPKTEAENTMLITVSDTDVELALLQAKQVFETQQ